MGAQFLAAAVVIAGMVSQLFFILGDRWRVVGEKRSLELLWAFLAFVPSKDEWFSTYSLFAHLLVFVFFVLLLLFAVFRDEIMPQVDEYVVVTWNLLCAYVAFHAFGKESHLFLLILIPVVLSFMYIITPLQPGPRVRGLLYLWQLIMTAIIGIVFFSAGAPASVLAFFVLGMVLLSLGSTLLFIFLLIPIPGKNQTFAERWQDCCESFAFMTRQYSQEQARVGVLVTYSIILSVVLVWNSYQPFVSNILLINILLVTAPFILWGLQSVGFVSAKKRGHR